MAASASRVPGGTVRGMPSEPALRLSVSCHTPWVTSGGSERSAVEAWLSVRGGDPIQGLQNLDEWLSSEPELRGKLAPRAAQPAPNELGASSDVLIAVLGSGGAVSVLAGSLRAFLARPRGADVRITVSSPNGRTVELEAQRAGDIEALIRQVLDFSDDQSPSGPAA